LPGYPGRLCLHANGTGGIAQSTHGAASAADLMVPGWWFRSEVFQPEKVDYGCALPQSHPVHFLEQSDTRKAKITGGMGMVVASAFERLDDPTSLQRCDFLFER